MRHVTLRYVRVENRHYAACELADMPGHCTQRTQSLLLTSPNINAADKHKRINGQRDRQTDIHTYRHARSRRCSGCYCKRQKWRKQQQHRPWTYRDWYNRRLDRRETRTEMRRRGRAVCMFKASNYQRVRQRRSGRRKPVNKWACGCRTKAVRVKLGNEKKLSMTDGGSHLNMTVST